MTIKIPKISKKLNSFLTKEDGSVSKKKLLKGSLIVGSIAILASNAFARGGHSSHNNSLKSTITNSYNPSEGSLTGTHAHHANHASHSSHSSY